VSVQSGSKQPWQLTIGSVLRTQGHLADTRSWLTIVVMSSLPTRGLSDNDIASSLTKTVVPAHAGVMQARVGLWSTWLDRVSRRVIDLISHIVLELQYRGRACFWMYEATPIRRLPGESVYPEIASHANRKCGVFVLNIDEGALILMADIAGANLLGDPIGTI
jgi:hypothetical protein